MKNHNKLLIILLAIIYSICVSLSVSAADDTDVVVSLQINDPMMEFKW